MTGRRPGSTRQRLASAFVVGIGIFAACCNAGAPVDAVRWSPDEVALILTLSPLNEPPPQPTNRVADDPDAALLGQRLFFDTALSADGSISCATCHKPALYFTDGQPRAVGLDRVARHTPSLIGAQWAPFVFWDGRKDSLWSQVLGPLETEQEHGTSRLGVAQRVFAHYRAAYEELFGPLPQLDDASRFSTAARPVPDDPDHPHARAWAAMTAEDREAVNVVMANVGKCIEAYERHLVPRESPFDRYAAELDSGSENGGAHMSIAAERGLRTFIGSGGCVRCHNGPLFTDFSFHNVGLPPATPDAEADDGRASGARQVLADPFQSGGDYSDGPRKPDLEYLNPDFDDFLGAFKTPSLRNVAATAPYGHAGQFGSLVELLDFYQELPRVPFHGHRDLMLKPLGPEVSVPDLVAFLETLTGPLPASRWLRAPAD